VTQANANLVKELRDKTGAGFVDCKKALEANENDMDRAISFLREKGLAAAAKKAGRSANEGSVGSYIHGSGKIGVLVEVNCETDFVARTDEFQEFVRNVAMHIAAASPKYLVKEEVPAAEVEKEKAIYRVQAEESGKKGPVIEKILEGKISKYYEEVCLMNQKYVRDPDKSIDAILKEAIAKLGENMAIRRFVRFQLGETGKATG
jgi:elongation factor Ts